MCIILICILLIIIVRETIVVWWLAVSLSFTTLCYFFEEKNPSSTLRSKEATPFPHSVTSLKKKGFTLGGVQTCPATSFTAGKTKTHLFLQTQAAGAAASIRRYRFHISASLAANHRIPLRQTPPLASARPPSQALWDGLRPRSWRCLDFSPSCEIL